MAFVEIQPDPVANAKFHKFNTSNLKSLLGEFLWTSDGNYGLEYTVLTKEGVKTFTPPKALKTLLEKANTAKPLFPGCLIAMLCTGEKDIGRDKPMLLFQCKVDYDRKLSDEGKKLLAAHNAPEQGQCDNDPFA